MVEGERANEEELMRRARADGLKRAAVEEVTREVSQAQRKECWEDGYATALRDIELRKWAIEQAIAAGATPYSLLSFADQIVAYAKGAELEEEEAK